MIHPISRSRTGLAPTEPHRPSRSRRDRAITALTLGLLGVHLALPAGEPALTRPLRDLNKDYFPFTPVQNSAEWKARRIAIKERIQVAAGLFPMPDKTPLNPVIHSRTELEDYTVDKVFFESLPGHFVTGNLYLPKQIRGKIPAIVCPHGHWPDGRFGDTKEAEVQRQLSSGAEQFVNAARSPMQARCVQLARLGCAAFLYDMVGYADSVQFTEHRHGPVERGFVSGPAELQLVNYFNLQTWNSIRALDFLASLPYVDVKRIGCTGESGGGTQTMMLSALDERIAAAFPCVMVSTAMQGGCTCENSDYLRIHQGNIDIAAATAPRPLGMTAADDWTKELEHKGFPDLKQLYTMLGVPNRVEAHFNIQFPHNYNAVSRAQMYHFFNQFLKLGRGDLAERDFKFLPEADLTVWNAAHPKPHGAQVGLPHEAAVVNWFQQQTTQKLAPLLRPQSRSEVRQARKILEPAWQVMIGHELPAAGASRLTVESQTPGPDCTIERGAVRCGRNKIETVFITPPAWKRDTVVWLSLQGSASVLRADGTPNATARRMLDRGFALAVPTLYLADATRNPNVYDDGRRKVTSSYEGFAAYQYGYNPTLFAERVSDALDVIAGVRDDATRRPRKILVAGMHGAGVIAAAATALAGPVVRQVACDTEGFRFGALSNVWDPQFLPGAAKYGDVPAVLTLCARSRVSLAGETSASVPAAVMTFARTKTPLAFLPATRRGSADALADALTRSE